MANVKFLKGLQANVPVDSGATDGAFYLTTDTHRLYVGNSEGKADLLSQSVFVVANVAALTDCPKVEGQFYYAKAENVLCTYSEANQTYIQINADTDTKVKTAEFGVTGATNSATISHTIHNVNKAGASAGDVASGNEVKIVGSGDVSVSGDATSHTITVKSNPYDINVGDVAEDQKSVSINLEKTDGDTKTNAGSVKIGVSGDGMTITKDDDSDMIVINSSAVAPVPTVKGANGETEGFDVTVGIVGGGSATGHLAPKIKLTSDKDAINFVDGVATLNVYSKDEVDKIKYSLDAVQYKGTVNSADELPTTGVQIGWMYKVGTAFGGYAVNDILIANGTENDEGVITGTISWDHIDTSDNEDTKYTLSSSGTVINLVGSGNANSGAITISGDDTLITTAGNGVNGIKVSHAIPAGASEGTVGTGSTTTVSGTGTTATTFKAVTGIKTDAAGHVIGATENTVTVVDTHISSNSLGVNSTKSTASNNKATIQLDSTIADTSGVSKSASSSFSIESTSLAITEPTAGAVAIELAWGAF